MVKKKKKRLPDGSGNILHYWTNSIKNENTTRMIQKSVKSYTLQKDVKKYTRLTKRHFIIPIYFNLHRQKKERKKYTLSRQKKKT